MSLDYNLWLQLTDANAISGQVEQNTIGISANVEAIQELRIWSMSNQAGLVQVQENVITLQGRVDANDASIATNASNIATNTADITTLQTSLGTSTDLVTTTAWGQARLSRPITNFSTLLRSTSALPSSRATAIMYGEVLLNLLDTGNSQERTIGNANITIKNAGNTNADVYLQLVVNGSITEIVTTVEGGANHSTTFPIAGFSSSIATSGSIPIRLNAWTLSGQTLTPTYIQIWGIGQMN